MDPRGDPRGDPGCDQPNSTTSELLSQDSILFEDVVDQRLLPAVHPAGEPGHHEIQRERPSVHAPIVVVGGGWGKEDHHHPIE